MATPTGVPTGQNTEGPTSAQPVLPFTPTSESPRPALPEPTRGLTLEQAAARLRARREGTPLPSLPGEQEHAAPRAQARAESGSPSSAANTEDDVEDLDLDFDIRDDLPPRSPGNADHGPLDEDDDPVIFHLDDGTPVRRSEGKKGFLRQRDYTQHRQQQSQEELQLQRELEETRRARQKYAQELDRYVKHLEGTSPKRPDPALENTNPYEYQAQNTAWLVHQEELRQARVAQEQAYREHREDMQRQFLQRAQQEAERALEVVPSLKVAKTEKERGVVLDRLKRTARAAGFRDEELANVIDHRILRILDWAVRGRAAEVAASRRRGNSHTDPSDRQNRDGPTISGATAGGSGQHTSSTARAVEEATKRFKQSRSMDAAIALRQAKRAHAAAERRKHRPTR